MKVETLHENEWLSLKRMVDPEQGVHGYVFSHETRCNGMIVTIMPHRIRDGKVEFLLRDEITPCWRMDSATVSSITGGVDDPKALGTITTTVKNEVLEEGGYEISVRDIVFLGTMYGVKSSDTKYFLFTMDLTGKKRVKASGDGSELEAKAHCFWASDIEAAEDPFVYALHYRVMRYMGMMRASK